MKTKMDTHKYEDLKTGKKYSYAVLDNGLNFTDVKRKHLFKNIAMIIKGYCPIKTEFNRDGENPEELTKLLEEHFPSYKDETETISDHNIYTCSKIDYRNIFSGKRKQIIFLERTPEKYAFVNFVFEKTEVVKTIERLV